MMRILEKGLREDMRTEYQYICRLHAGEFRDPEYEVYAIGCDQKFKTVFCPENGRVAYQIKGNETYDKMQANTLNLGGGKKVKTCFSLKVEMLHIK